LRSDSPTFSSIRLADGPLTVHDLESLGSPAHHWVLATCDLGRPGTLAGPALEGVVATLLARGSGAVIAATVSVPDVDTRDLMVELHRRLAAGGSMAESLRRARVAVDPSTPSGFVAGTAFTCYGGG
jgi:CHAT domain-containing protein